jgi:hypothetical protein
MPPQATWQLPACQALAGVAYTTACRTLHLVKRRRRDLRSVGANDCAHVGDNPTGVRHRPAGAAGHTDPGLGLGHMTEAACLAGPQDSAPSQDRVGRQGT